MSPVDWKKNEAVHRKRPGGKQGVAREVILQLHAGARFEPSHGDMGGKVTALRLKTSVLYRGFQIFLQRQQRCARFHSHPQRANLAARSEMAHSFACQIKRCSLYTGYIGGDLVCSFLFHLTDEAKSKMEVFRRYPACPRHATAQPHQTHTNVPR